jgi:hypothetical protein
VRCRVEDWRADLRLRWVSRGFHLGPQSGCHHHVSSPRHIERSVRISRTTLTCLLRAVAYGTYPTEQAFRRANTSAYSTSLSLFSLRRSAYLPVLVLQITGRVYQFALASHTVRRITNSRAASLRGLYSASSLLPARPTPSRLRPAFPVSPVIRPTLLRRFRSGTSRVSPVAQRVLVTMPSITTPPECPIASVSSRWSMLPSP